MASSSSNLQDYVQHHSKKMLSNPQNLPANQMTVMKLLTKPKEMSYKQLCKAVEDLPVVQRLNQSQLDGTLYELIRLGYVTSFMQDGDVIYMVQVNIGEPPQPRHEQHLLRKLDLADLNLDILHGLNDDDPEV